MTISSSHPILEFWFGKLSPAGTAAPEKVQRWWKKSPDFDDECRRLFEADLQGIVAGERPEPGDARAHLAAILLCDQISRNIYRDTPQAFATDPLALQFTLYIMESKLDAGLLRDEKSFVYMPLMHSEDPKIQELSVQKFGEIALEGTDSLEYAKRHKAIIDRFGRYPHRNAILGRESTPEEIEFLKEPGSSF